MSQKSENRIRQVRESRGLSQENVAEQLGTFNQQISHLELGKRRLTWDWMVKLAKVFACHPLELVGWQEPYFPAGYHAPKKRKA